MPGYGVLAVRLFLGPLLLLSGETKLTRGGFRSAVLEYRVLPDKLATLYATATPWLELLTAFALIAGVIVRVAAIAATALFVSFGGGIAVNLWRGRNLDCHCFGQMYSETLSVMSLVRVAVLAIGSVMLAVSEPAFVSPSHRATVREAVIATAIAALALEAYFLSGAAVQTSKAFRLFRPARAPER